jgi:hypothetical protein
VARTRREHAQGIDLIGVTHIDRRDLMARPSDGLARACRHREPGADGLGIPVEEAGPGAPLLAENVLDDEGTARAVGEVSADGMTICEHHGADEYERGSSHRRDADYIDGSSSYCAASRGDRVSLKLAHVMIVKRSCANFALQRLSP